MSANGTRAPAPFSATFTSASTVKTRFESKSAQATVSPINTDQSTLVDPDPSSITPFPVM